MTQFVVFVARVGYELRNKWLRPVLVAVRSSSPFHKAEEEQRVGAGLPVLVCFLLVVCRNRKKKKDFLALEILRADWLMG